MLARLSPICERLAKITLVLCKGCRFPGQVPSLKFCCPLEETRTYQPKMVQGPGIKAWFDVLSCVRQCPVSLQGKISPGHLPDNSWDPPHPAGTYLLISPQAQGQVLPLQFGNLRTTMYVLVWNITHGAREGRGESRVPESFRSVSWFNKQNLEVLVVCFLLAFSFCEDFSQFMTGNVGLEYIWRQTIF